MQQLVQKRSQKSNQNLTLYYISLPIYSFHFSKFCLIQKQKNAKNLWVFGENGSRCLSNFLQTHIF